MSAKGRRPLVPRLRFPEFLNEEAWSEKKLGEIGNFLGGGTPSTSNPEYWDGNIQWYTPKEIKNRMLKPSMRTISKDGLKKSSAKLLPKGAILITTRATIGDVAIANKECATNQGFQSLVVNETEFNLFWYYWILLYKNELIKRSSGSTFKEIRKTKIEVIPTFSPNKSEQQKIAACLTALDDLISAATARLDALKQHKQGLMQQLFPAEGETVPRLRFPEFRDAGEWVEDTLENRGCFTGGGTPNKGNQAFWRGNFPWVSSSDISEDTIHHIEITKFITKGAIEKSATKVVPRNSLLIVARVAVGKVAVTIDEISTSQDFINFTPQIDDVIFLGYYLKYNKNVLLGFSQGMAIQGFTKNDIATLILSFPANRQEQQKIAACLTALDDLISAQTQKIAELKTHKRGLMQQLFPAVDEAH